MTAVETIDVEWVRAPADGGLASGRAVAWDLHSDLDLDHSDWLYSHDEASIDVRFGHVDDAVAPGVYQDVERRGIGVFLRGLVRRIAPPARYRMVSSVGGWDFQDWESLIASISYLREMGFDVSTLRVESLTAQPAPALTAPEPSAQRSVGVIAPAFASASERRRRYGALDRAA